MTATESAFVHRFVPGAPSGPKATLLLLRGTGGDERTDDGFHAVEGSPVGTTITDRPRTEPYGHLYVYGSHLG